jgi:filamentous hemagglutinin family protein
VKTIRRVRVPVHRHVRRTAFACLILAAGAVPVARAQLQVKGTTATTVVADPSGRYLVTPAAPQAGVSYNAFSRFDVSASGAVFQNQDVKARTIVAEVFSPLASRIEGPVAVDGPRANLILANQNGLRVNGGSFVNFGSVALTTGEVILRDAALGDGMQRYVDLKTRGGDIVVESGGLQADVIRLEFVARKLGIEGPVTNSFTSGTAYTRVVSGASDASFDTLASPTDNLTPWMSYKAAGSTEGTPAAQGIAIDLNAGSAIRSGRIELVVTDAGADVRNAGTLSATLGNLRITSSGQIENVGGRMEAAGDIRLNGRSFQQRHDGERIASVVAGGSLRVDTTEAIRVDGGTIQGQTAATDDENAPYAVFLNAGTRVDASTQAGSKEGTVLFGAAGSVGIQGKRGVAITNARAVSNGKLHIESDGLVAVESLHVGGAARRDWFSSYWYKRKNGFAVDRGQLADPDHLAYGVAQDGVTIRAGSVRNSGGILFSNAGPVDIQAAGDVTNQALVVGGFDYSRRCVFFVCKRSAHSTEQLIGGQISAGSSLRIKAGGTILNEGGQFLSVGDQEIDGAKNIARAIPIQRALVRADGLKAIFGDTWGRLYAVDQGGGFTSQQGKVILRGTTQQEGGFFAAKEGVEGVIDIIRLPQREPVTIENHLGILRW